jgi:hypothetical protein
MTHCKTCGAEIIFAKTPEGKNMPVDVSPDPNGNIVLYQRVDTDGKSKWFATVLGSGEHRPDIAYVAHWATCPHATQHRRPQRQPKEEPRMGRGTRQSQDRDIITYKQLLEQASKAGIARLESKIYTLPNDMNGQYAACEATLEMSDGRTFSDVGDASSESVQRTIRPHLLRMASTRAKARCLRDALNFGDPVAEEFEDATLEGEYIVPSSAGEPQPRYTEDEEDYAADIQRAIDDSEIDETHESVMNDIRNLINNAPSSKRNYLPTIDQALEYAGRSKDYAIATRLRINGLLSEHSESTSGVSR